MSILFGNMWGYLMRAGALRPRSLASCVAEVGRPTRARSPDAMMARLMAAPTPAALLAAVQAHQPMLTHKHLLQALKCLFQMHKENQIQKDIIKDPAFDLLCQNFKKHARALDVNEAIEATKFLSFLGVPANSLIVQTMLQVVRSNINQMNIRQIMFLDFLLGKFDVRNHLVDALKLALPLAFQIHLSLEFDDKDLNLLRDMLSYSCNHELPDRCINNIVTGLLLHDQVIDAHVAKSVTWSLCQVNCTEEVHPTRVQLLHICYDILTEKLDRLSFNDILWTAAKIKGRMLEKHPEYYHEQLLDAIAQYVINKEVPFEKALLVARVLSRIAHTNLALTEYLCSLAAAQPSCVSDARANVLFGFVNCLANNDYTPDRGKWGIIRESILGNKVLDGTQSTLPWAKFCLELASLGVYDDRLLRRVFSKEYLDEVLAGEPSLLDYLQLLTLHEAVQVFHDAALGLPADVLTAARAVYPTHALTAQVAAHLARALGGNRYVATDVLLPSGIVADLVVCSKAGRPQPLGAPGPPRPRAAKMPYDQLAIPPDAEPVSILIFNQGCYSVNSGRLRGPFRVLAAAAGRRGPPARPLNAAEWLNAPPHERAPYLLRELGYKCGDTDVKLSNV